MANESWKTNIAHRTVHLVSLGCTKNLIDSILFTMKYYS